MTSRNFPLNVVTASLLMGCAAQAAPTGHLAYLKDNHAVVSNAATGKTWRLPRSKGAQVLALSPRGLSVYFVARPGFGADGTIPQNGFASAPPYRLARKLPAGLQDETLGQLKWNPSASTLYLRGFEIQGAYSPASNRFDKFGELPDTQSRDGKREAIQRNDAIYIRDVPSKRERLIWSSKTPQVLVEALKRAKNPAKLRQLSGSIDPQLWKQPYSWAVSSSALTPDGSRLFFCCNVGSGVGAAGNSIWAIFAADLKSGRIEVLSKVGEQIGRTPDAFEVSPDGKRLLVTYSAHSSAVENPVTVLVIDLATQNSRELIGKIAPKTTDNNMVDGVAWSPDGKYIATAAYFFKTADAWKNIDNGNKNIDGPPDKDWTLYIQDAATGKVVKRIAGARGPSWAR